MDTHQAGVKINPTKRNRGIHGLRGFAVLLVLLCHLEVPGFRNGFFGVDIFFVISGFLITHHLSLEYISNRKASGRQGWISFVGFYARRARRIVPTAFFVLFVTLFAAIWLENRLTLNSNTTTDAVWALFFLSNLNFMGQSVEYFGQAVQQSPFLHYWSLAVEEQFYLLWPTLFLLATATRGFKFLGIVFSWRNRLKLVMAIVFVFSFSVYLLQLYQNSPSSYFSSIGRFWEFAVGSFFALLGNNDKIYKLRKFHMLAAACVVIAFFLMNEYSFRFLLIIPVVLTGSILKEFLNSGLPSFFSQIFGWNFLNILGTLSFSLYLVHWPVIVFAKASGVQIFGFNLLWIGPLIFLATWITYREVESRFMRLPIPTVSRRSAARRTRYFPLNYDALKYSALSIIGLIFVLNFQQGVSQPFITSKFKPQVVEPWNPPTVRVNPSDSASVTTGPENDNFLQQRFLWDRKIIEGVKLSKLPDGMSAKFENLDTDRISNWDNCLNVLANKPECNKGSLNAEKKVFVLGDSYAYGVIPMLAGALDWDKYYIISRTKAECIVPEVQTVVRGKVDESCTAHRERVNSEIAKTRPDLIVVASVNSSQIRGSVNDLSAGMLRTLKFLVANATDVLVIGETPFMADPRNCIKSGGVFSDCLGSANARGDYRSLTRKSAELAGAKYLDITPWLCISNKCPVVIDGAFTTWDGGHVTAEMSSKLAPFLRESLLSLGIVSR